MNAPSPWTQTKNDTMKRTTLIPIRSRDRVLPARSPIAKRLATVDPSNTVPDNIAPSGLHVWFQLRSAHSAAITVALTSPFGQDAGRFSQSKTAVLWWQTEATGPTLASDLKRVYRTTRCENWSKRPISSTESPVQRVVLVLRNSLRWHRQRGQIPCPPGKYTLCIEAAEKTEPTIIRNDFMGTEPIEQKPTWKVTFEIAQARSSCTTKANSKGRS